MADKKKMSVEEILAACRQSDGEGGIPQQDDAPQGVAPTKEVQSTEAEAPAAEPVADEPASAPAKPAGEMSVEDILAAARGEKKAAPAKSEKKAPAKPPASAPTKSPGEMSVADILAAARGEKAADKPKAPAKAKPAAKKSSPKAPAAAKQPVGPMDTSSILAAARKAVKPGPMSKAEAAKRGDVPAGKAKPKAPPMPAKPAYAKQAAVAAKPKRKDDRRGFFEVFLGSFLAIGFTSLALIHSLWGLLAAKFFFPNILIEPPSRFKIGFPSEFAPDTVDARFKAQFGIWVTNVNWEGQQEIVALKTVCTHLGCTPNWLEAEQKFKCPCHGSGFYKDGVNFEGPAPRPLERYAISLADDGQLEVDKSRKFQQEMGQWKDPACFVPV